MQRQKAIDLVGSILETHRRAVIDGTHPERAFDNARSDLVGLVNTIFDTCVPVDTDEVADGDDIKLAPSSG